MRALDDRLFRAVNRWAVQTPALHATGRAVDTWAALAVLAICVVMAWLRGRRRADAPVAVASALWAVLSAAVAYGVARPVASAVGRSRPYQVIPHVEVLVARTHAPGLPSVAAAVAGAAAASLWPSDRTMAVIASAAAGLLAAAQVYTGAFFPGDVVGGLALGALLALALRPVGLRLLAWVTVKVERSPAHLVVAAHRA